MTTTTLTSREFNQDSNRAKRAAMDGPVIITDRGRPAHVLLSIEEYRRLTHRPLKMSEMLSSPEVAEIDFEPERLNLKPRPVDFT